MELNHIVPRYKCGGHEIENLEQLWPWAHAAVDPFRFYTGPTPRRGSVVGVGRCQDGP